MNLIDTTMCIKHFYLIVDGILIWTICRKPNVWNKVGSSETIRETSFGGKRVTNFDDRVLV